MTMFIIRLLCTASVGLVLHIYPDINHEHVISLLCNASVGLLLHI